MSDVQALLTRLQAEWTEFRSLNDRRYEEIQAQGAASAETTAAVERANATLSRLEADLKAAQARLEVMEVAAQRPTPGGRDAEEQDRRHAAQFWSMLRGASVDPSSVDASGMDTYRAYRRAFLAYAVKGPGNVSPEVQAALSVGVDPSGGYFVPPDTAGRIVEYVHRTSPLRQVATIETTSRTSKTGRLDLDEAGAGWVGETEPRPETASPDVGAWEIPVREMYAEPRSTQTEIEDADVDIEAWLVRKIGEKFSRLENAAFVGGNSPKRPRGFTTYPYQAAAVSKSTWGKIRRFKSGANGAFITPTTSVSPGDVLVEMLVSGMKPEYRANATWAMNSLTMAKVRTIKDSGGQYLLVPDFGNGPAVSLLGRPVLELNDLPDIGNDAYALFLADWREAYTIVDRRGITMLRDPFTAKPWVKFYATKRVGGDLLNFDAICALQFAQ